MRPSPSHHKLRQHRCEAKCYVCTWGNRELRHSLVLVRDMWLQVLLIDSLNRVHFYGNFYRAVGKNCDTRVRGCIQDWSRWSRQTEVVTWSKCSLAAYAVKYYKSKCYIPFRYWIITNGSVSTCLDLFLNPVHAQRGWFSPCLWFASLFRHVLCDLWCLVWAAALPFRAGKN